jgi:hypothetical protein
MQGFLTQPVPIVFTVCKGVQQITDGTFNILSVFDRLSLYRMPDGSTPPVVTLPTVTVWTGGQGNFKQVLTVLDADGAEVAVQESEFQLTSTSHRHYVVGIISVPAKEGVCTLTVGRPDMELLRQDFTVGFVPFPGTPR